MLAKGQRTTPSSVTGTATSHKQCGAAGHRRKAQHIRNSQHRTSRERKGHFIPKICYVVAQRSLYLLITQNNYVLYNWYNTKN